MKVEDIFGDLPTLETDRLILRKIKKHDIEDMYLYGSNEEVAKYVTWDAHKSLSDTEAFMNYALAKYKNKDVAPWAIQYKENGKMIGTIDFIWWKPKHYSAEIGYVISQDYWGMGICTEAAKEMIKFGFEKMNLVRIQAKCMLENIGSEKVMEKIGMVYEGTLRKEMVIKQQHQDLKVYSILLEEFEDRRQP
ncbi:GNAT family N-acetyltransferase [Oceanobacillus saliphilus]|uniref:GNAT family N-acetyltransferase n=1 Tax=Oceanobacillus saliphilus TaxID=2925834 RepID=UPI00201E2F2F|nr:GNAT family protein [Oceanobacillus saliphilus]